MHVFYSQMVHLSISSVTFCRFPHNLRLVLYISEKASVSTAPCIQKYYHQFYSFSFDILLYRTCSPDFCHSLLCNTSPLPSLWFSVTGSLSHTVKKERTLSSAPQTLVPYWESSSAFSCSTFSCSARPHHFSPSSPCPPPKAVAFDWRILPQLPKRHKNKAQAVTACALSRTISPLAAPMVRRWSHSSSFN